MSLRGLINRVIARGRIEFVDAPLCYYADKLARGVPFSFARFGDGEWMAILGRTGANCDGHRYFPELGQRLREAATEDRGYTYGIQRSSVRKDGAAIAAFLRRHEVRRQWRNADVFHYASRDGMLFPLVEQLRRMEVVVVGPAHLRSLDCRVFRYTHFVEVPARNCFLELRRIKNEILRWGRDRSSVVYSISASMAANLLVHDLVPIIGKSNWLVDFGSLWDVYAGRASRRYMGTISHETIEKNLTGSAPS